MKLAQAVLISRPITAAAPDQVEKTYSITASPDVIQRFENFLAYVQYCSGVGHSATVGFDIDGDGADRFKVQEKLPSVDQDNVVNRNQAFETYR